MDVAKLWVRIMQEDWNYACIWQPPGVAATQRVHAPGGCHLRSSWHDEEEEKFPLAPKFLYSLIR